MVSDDGGHGRSGQKPGWAFTKLTERLGTVPIDLFDLGGGLAGTGPLARATSAMQRMIRGRMETWNSGLDVDGEPTPWNEAPAPDLDPKASALGRGVLGILTPADVRRPEPMARQAEVPPTAAPHAACFLSGTFVNAAGSRPYKLFVPSGYRPDEPIPLVVMLHGCTQSPDDFAAGTRMNEAAERQNVLVVYPGQTRSANIQKCWNWFQEKQQRRDAGEPSLIAGITLDVASRYSVDRRRIYVAGLSAGGAAATIMGDTYPDIYAAIGVHSGLACGAAFNLSSAMTAMRGGTSYLVRAGQPAADATRAAGRRIVPAIVFHGDRDGTVHLRNAEQVVVQSAGGSKLVVHTSDVHVEDGHDYSLTTGIDDSGETVIEKWVVHGGGHAWSGGSPNGSYTDPHGPDATAEMLRFFLAHELPAASG